VDGVVEVKVLEVAAVSASFVARAEAEGMEVETDSVGLATTTSRSVGDFHSGVGEQRDSIFDEYILVDSQVVLIEGLNRRIESRAMMGSGVPAALRGQLAKGRGMGPFAGRGKN